jgi:hypothetical protein
MCGNGDGNPLSCAAGEPMLSSDDIKPNTRKKITIMTDWIHSAIFQTPCGLPLEVMRVTSLRTPADGANTSACVGCARLFEEAGENLVVSPSGPARVSERRNCDRRRPSRWRGRDAPAKRTGWKKNVAPVVLAPLKKARFWRAS